MNLQMTDLIMDFFKGKKVRAKIGYLLYFILFIDKTKKKRYKDIILKKESDKILYMRIWIIY